MATEIVRMMPLGVFGAMILIAVLATAYAWMKNDDDNYTDVIASFVAFVVLGITSFAFYGGITYTAGTDIIVYRSNAVGYLLTVWAVIMGLFGFVKIYDAFNKNMSGMDGWMKK